MEGAMTQDEAITLAESRWWEHYTPAEAARFQLGEPMLCMPFVELHRCTEVLLGRPVWTHEFADAKGLLAEADGSVAAPAMAEIIAKLAVGRVEASWLPQYERTTQAIDSGREALALLKKYGEFGYCLEMWLADRAALLARCEGDR